MNCALNDAVAGLPVYDPEDPCGPGDDYHPWTNADRFNYSPYNLTLTPSRRQGAFAQLEHIAADNLRLYGRFFSNRRESINRGCTGARLGRNTRGKRQRSRRHRDRCGQPV